MFCHIVYATWGFIIDMKSCLKRYVFPAALVLATLMLGACQGVDYNWGWYEVLPSTEKGAGNLRFLFSGIWLTVALSSVSIFFSVIVGLFISLPGLSTNNYVRGINRSILGLQELTRKANELTVTVYRPLEIYTVLVLEYLILILIVSWMVRRLESRLGANLRTAHRS